MEDERINVLMETEGTYPYVGGGVSTWCDILCRELPQVDYYICAITGDPNVAFKYQLPSNAKVIHVPLWGTEEPAEFILPDVPFSEIYKRKQKTTPEAVQTRFIHLFRNFLQGMEEIGLDITLYGRTIHQMYRYFLEYDYIETFKSDAVWQVFQEEMLRPYEEQEDRFLQEERPSIFDLTTCLRWLQKLLMILNAPIPDTDVTHATISAFVGLASVIAKLEHGTPMILTEHGVYIRERYIGVSATDFTYFQKRFLINLSVFVSRLCYAYADQISPVCDFNKRWERLYGVPEEKLQTIYNGVNPDVFRPADKPPKSRDRPTVVAAARVFPLKDIKTMIRTADIVRRTIPNVMFTVYGSLTADPPYVQECQALVEELEVGDNFELAGFHSEPSEIYNEGDISILTSISEGFPYTVLESMSCARPVVATDVGGVRESLEGFGIVTKPRDPQALAEGAIKLLQNDELRQVLGRQARNEVLAKYRTSTSVNAYLESYQRWKEEKKRMRQSRAETATGDSPTTGPSM